MQKTINELIRIINKNTRKHESKCEDFQGYAIEAIIGGPFQDETPILLSILKENKEQGLGLKRNAIIEKCIEIFGKEHGFKLAR